MERPVALRCAYILAFCAAVLLIVSGLVLISAQVDEVAAKNFRFMALANIIGGIIVAGLAGQMLRGTIMTRRIYLGVCAVLVALNLLAVIIRVGSFGLMVIAFVLASSVICYFQPRVTKYLGESRG